jgi:hypothetical protein
MMGISKMPKIGEVKLKVAPGIFFAILGAAIVYFSTDRSISFSSGVSSAGDAVSSASAKENSFGYQRTSPGSYFGYSQQPK